MTRRTVPQFSNPEPLAAETPGKQWKYSTALGVNMRTGGPAPTVAAPAKKPSYTIITCQLLIPGDGEPLQDGALVVEGKIIDWVGKRSDIPSKYRDHPHNEHHVPYMMPGLWDCHVHFMGVNIESAIEDGSASLALLAENPASAGARLTKGCWEAIQRGYTSMRDLAGYGCELAKAIDDGSIVGPNVYGAGACLSQLAGHGDVFVMQAGDVLANLGVNSSSSPWFGLTMTCLVDGLDECRRGVRLQVRRGAKCIKVMASGGVGSRDDNIYQAQFSQEELDLIVSEATRAERSVAAHVHGKPGILQAVRAGVTSVEHVSFADEECIDLINEKGVIYVATRTVIEEIKASNGEGMTKKSWEKAKQVIGPATEAYKLAIKKGCTFALGTDTEPGYNMAVELQYAVEAGLSSLEAIKAATANGPLTVKGQAPLTGQLKAGYEADILGVCEDPVADVKVLQKMSNIGWVWKGGKLFKGPGVGPWGEE